MGMGWLPNGLPIRLEILNFKIVSKVRCFYSKPFYTSQVREHIKL
jgi:hypothetical protein